MPGGGYAGVVLDLDGVVVRGSTAIPGAPAAVAALRRAGLGVAFATNNATRTPQQVAELLRAAGVPAHPHEVATAAVAAASLLPPGARCLVIGMDGLREALAARGCQRVEDPAEAEAVVVGLDTGLTYDALRRATLALRAGARFVATNTDATFPAPEGLVPGNGATVAALVTASGRRPEVAGKPHPPLLRAAAATLPEGHVLMVGDRADTDLDGAVALGWDSALVLSGVTGRDDLDGRPRPTYLLDDLAALPAALGL